MIPQNPKESVDEFFRVTGFDPSTVISEITCTNPDTPLPNIQLPVSLKTLVTNYLDIWGTPRRYFFELLSYFATEEVHQERLRYFGSPEGQDDLRRYNHREKRTFVEVLADFSSARFPRDCISKLEHITSS